MVRDQQFNVEYTVIYNNLASFPGLSQFFQCLRTTLKRLGDPGYEATITYVCVLMPIRKHSTLVPTNNTVLFPHFPMQAFGTMGILFPLVIPTICELESNNGGQCRVDIIAQAAAAIMASSIFGNGEIDESNL